MSDSETDTLNHSGGECWHVLSVSSRSRTIWYFLCTCWELFQTWQLLSCWTGFSHSEVYFNSVHLVFLSDFQNYRMRCFFHGTHSRLTQRDVFFTSFSLLPHNSPPVVWVLATWFFTQNPLQLNLILLSVWGPMFWSECDFDVCVCVFHFDVWVPISSFSTGGM